MNSKSISVCVLLISTITACDGFDQSSPETINLTQSISSINEDDTGQALSALEVSERQQIADNYIDSQMEEYDIVDTRVSPTGQTIYYVTVESLYPGYEDAPYIDPPPEELTLSDGEEIDTSLPEGEFEALTEYQVESYLHAPEGTIPIIRPDYSYWITGKGDSISYSTLGEFLDSIESPQPPGVIVSKSGAGRLYAGDVDHYPSSGNYFKGNSAYLNTWNIKDPSYDDFSLVQGALTNSFNGKTSQTLEAGLQKYGKLNGHQNVAVFVYYTMTGYDQQGWKKGGYANTFRGRGFIQRSGSFPPGAILHPSYFSQRGQNQYTCRFQFRLYQENWWVYACGQWLGYYPTTGSSAVPYSKRFNDFLTPGAKKVTWYSEMMDDDPQVWMPYDSGSGRHAVEGFRQAAYVRNMIYWEGSDAYNDYGSSYWWPESAPISSPSNSNCYSSNTSVSNSSSSHWRRSYYYGGPGKNNVCN